MYVYIYYIMSLLLIIELIDYITKMHLFFTNTMHYIAFYSRELMRIIFFIEIYIR